MATFFLLLLSLIHLLLVFTFQVCSFECGTNQFTVQDVVGHLSCIECPSCPPGQGLNPQCGSYVKYGTTIQCQPCELGSSYSSSNDSSSCFPCGICSEHQYIIKNCTLQSNSKCKHSCTSGFYFEQQSGDCQPCSWCCGDKEDLPREECHDMPYYKQCDLNQNFNCQPRCQRNQYIEPTENGPQCIGCNDCPAGYEPSPSCGTVVENKADITCKKCIAGLTFSPKHGKIPCKSCTKCSVGQKELRPCNTTHDTLCGDCDKGFYRNETSSCKPCSSCCNDDEDVRIEECVKQKMQRNKQCSYTQRAINVCQQRNLPTEHKSHRVHLLVPIVSVMLVSFGIFLAVYLMLRWRRKRVSLPYSSLSATATMKAETQTEVEHPNTHGSQETLAFDKSGVCIQFLDPESYLDHADVITLQTCWDKSQCPTLQENEVQLSPVIKLHPHGLKLTKEVNVRIPHSAFVFFSHGWELHLKSCRFEKGKTVSWKDCNEFQVHNNEVSFVVNSLEAFVVTGKAISHKPTKKRLQCAVFGGEGQVGVDYRAVLYIFDDCEASLEKIMQEEKANGHILLGSIQSLHVECTEATDVHITVQQPVPGWIVGEIKPQVIMHKNLKESYQTIPRSEILFKHDNGKNRDFMCTFKLTGGDETTDICAVASIKEDQLKRLQMHASGHSKPLPYIVTGRNQGKPLIIDPERASPCLQDVPADVLHNVAVKLDTLYRGVGNWRHVGERLGFSHKNIEEFGREYLSPTGSPSTVLLQAINERSPQLTVREFVQILQTQRIKRFDIIDVLKQYLYKQESAPV